MHRSFRSRLAALEVLEAQQGALVDPGALTVDDCVLLLDQIGWSNVRLEDGRAVRRWRVNGDATNAAIDMALLRLNAMLVMHLAPPADTDHLAYGLARFVASATPDSARIAYPPNIVRYIAEVTHEEL